MDGVGRVSKDYSTPMPIKAFNKLAGDPDSRIGGALVQATLDKHWTVRAAALSAIARHGDPRLISAVTPPLTDKKPAVRYTAAAAVIRLSASGET
jgi:HEAT repeat protein